MIDARRGVWNRQRIGVFARMNYDPETIQSRTEAIEERPEVPLDGLILGYGPMLPFPAAALAVWLGDRQVAGLALALVILWGAAILIFLSGVRRGVSFRTPGGPRTSQLAMMLWLFLAGLAALVIPPWAALILLAAGYASVMLLDPAAAQREEAPLYFARLRPPQMAIPVASLAAILAAFAFR